MKKGLIILVVVLLLGLIGFGIANANKATKIYNYSNKYYSFKYDNTWSINKKDKEVELIHKKSKGKVIISYKVLDTYLIDVDLKEILIDLVYEIENQNKDYKLINKEFSEDNIYSLLYENDKEECLVRIVKQDNIILFVYYNSLLEYFDITIDNFDDIFNSISINTGEKIDEKD